MTLEAAAGIEILPAWVDLGTGRYADDFGINVYGVMLCAAGYLAGAVVPALRTRLAGPATIPARG
jgi:hypothetical protein